MNFLSVETHKTEPNSLEEEAPITKTEYLEIDQKALKQP